MRSVEIVLALVVLATVVAAFAGRLRVPAPSLLVVAGVVAGLLPGVPDIRVSPEVVSLVVLPPLLFAAGEELPWRDLRAVWRPVGVLAFGLVAASAAAVAVVANAITPLPLGMAFVLGAVLASTDPVAVTALGRRLSLPPRVQALVQAESLFNDATSLLLFRIALSVGLAAGAVDWGHTAADFGILVGGGLLVAALVAGGAYLVRRHTEDPVLETVISLVTPYAAYVLAEAIGGSGVTAVVVTSVILGTQATKVTSSRIRIQLGAVYGTVVFLLESVVFGLIGLELPELVRALTTTTMWPLEALLIAVTLLVVRLLWVFPLSAALQRRSGRSATWQVPTVVSWAGARGVVPLAAALSIPLTAPAEYRELVLLLTTAVIVVTLVVQGFTLAPLVRRTGVALTTEHVQQERSTARLRLTQAGLDHLDSLTENEAAPEFLLDQLRDTWKARMQRIAEDEPDEMTNLTTADSYRRLRRELLAVEADELERLFQTGEITDHTRRRIQRMLDLEHTVLGDDEH
ncbi:Na+/H+ antiporter [Amycolatopsis alkalitolerans]|uniref:Na+/H+ antiporter n=1 Tax=Amycolatopsis alkalitolerans TaxID=2547244 RepID=A0A5C4M2I8_9PSEU|nr:Na+/H+ antiporter [Amycolatopsis alkalitolerans]TNC23993.1 Na+/H+ antiporter [Amycolatopsis alkalitolerans]